jgi:DNA-binding NtrC family response regulator
VAARILIADSDAVLAEGIARSLLRQGYAVEQVQTLGDALRVLEASYFDVLVAGVELAIGPGTDLLERAQAMTEPPLCFLMAGRADVRSAVEAMRRGATDYLEKPIDIGALALKIERALGTATMRRRLAALDKSGLGHLANPIAASPQMQLALRIADRVAASPSSSALILGESGVGKEVIATRIHERSKQKNGPFVRVNMAALPDTMVEAELFGSVRGAFTDAKRDRSGFFASADGGTLLLDELCEFKVALQSKLLRALESRRFFPVGSDRERPLNARVLAATNRDPDQAIADGELRADLYYRLAPVIINIAPLRERPEDIVPLALRFIATSCADHGSAPLTLSADAEHALLDHDWPGNARELRNAMERAIMLADSNEITADLLSLTRKARVAEAPISLPPRPAPKRSGAMARVLPTPASVSLDDAKRAMLEEVERAYIKRVLEQAGGSKTRAAEILGVSRTTLWEKTKRYGLK